MKKKKGHFFSDLDISNPFLYNGAITKRSSINRLVLHKLPLDGIEDSIKGKTGFEVFSTDLIIEEIKSHAKELSLQLDKIEAKELPIYLSQALESKDSSIRARAEKIAELFGKRLGLIFLTLKKGEKENRDYRQDWEDKHWDYWSKVQKVILAGGLASGILGKRIKDWVEHIFMLANEKPYEIILPKTTSNAALVGCSSYIKESNSVNLVFDLGQSYIKRGIAFIKDGSLQDLENLSKVPSKHVDWEEQDEAIERSEGYKLHEYLVNTIYHTYLEADKGPIGSEIVISIANYVNNGVLLDNRGGYAKLTYLADNYEKYLAEAISKKLNRDMQVKLVHDGTAVAAAFREYGDAVCISLGTAFGVGFV